MRDRCPHCGLPGISREYVDAFTRQIVRDIKDHNCPAWAPKPVLSSEPTDTSFTTNECQVWQLTDQPVPQSGPGDLMGALGQLGQIIARNPGSAPPPPANPGG